MRLKNYEEIAKNIRSFMMDRDQGKREARTETYKHMAEGGPERLTRRSIQGRCLDM
jgi:hypothetical protein